MRYDGRMIAAGWRKLDDDQTAWDNFNEKFAFFERSHNPAIREPFDSKTYDIRTGYSNNPLQNDLHFKTLIAFRKCLSVGDQIVVLDWQHQSYLLDPYLASLDADWLDWPIEILPDGDWHIFLSSDLRFGIFGDMFEHSLCVFGEELLQAFSSDEPSLFSTPIRIGGRPL